MPAETPRPLWSARDHSVPSAYERLRQVAGEWSERRFNVVIWSHEHSYEVERHRFGQTEVEIGYYAPEEDLINELQAKGDRWKCNQAANVEEVRQYLRKASQAAVIILGFSPVYLAHAATYYLEAIPEGPKTVLLEYHPEAWQQNQFLLWRALQRLGRMHLLDNFVHLKSKQSNRQYLPQAYEVRRIDATQPLWQVPSDLITAEHVLNLFIKQIEEGPRLDYKAAAAVADGRDVRKLVRVICSLANAQGGTVVIGIAEKDGAPNPSLSEGLQSVAKPDAAINRIYQSLQSEKGIEVPSIEARTVTVKGRKIIVLHVAESVTKQCGLKLLPDGRRHIPTRRGRITDWKDAGLP